MRIRLESVHHYLNLIREGWHFSFVGYSDAEWRCIFGGEWEGTTTGLGQIICSKHGELLSDVIRRRHNDERFMFAVPNCLWNHKVREGGYPNFKQGLPGFAEGQIDWWLGNNNIQLIGWERDRVLDDLAASADLYPMIRLLQDMRTVMVGPKELWPTMEGILRLTGFVSIESPNLHMREGGINLVVNSVMRLTAASQENTVVLVSAGVSAAVIIDRLQPMMPRCWLIDCGSIWDAFVGIGGQRLWRKELYNDTKRWEKWKHDNLQGKENRTC